MDNLWIPYLLLMLLLSSGSFWILLISKNRRHGAAREQWLKYFMYLLIVNVIWFGIALFDRGILWIGGLVILGATAELAGIALRKRYKGFPLFFLIILMIGFWQHLSLDRSTILYTYFVVVLFDGAGQVSGQMFGKRKLAPRISPGKTVEGVLGGAVVALSSALLTVHSFSMNWLQVLWTAPLVMGAAVTGDLMASALKRRVNIESFSRALPGHGGVLDRFDSWLAAGSLTYLLFIITG